MAAVRSQADKRLLREGIDTAPATCPPRRVRRAKNVIRTVSDMRRHFCCNERPIYSISATDFNLAGMQHWVRNFRHISYIDSHDGRNPSVFVPARTKHEEFQSIEDVNNYLLAHEQVIDYVKTHGGKPVGVFLMFDQATEALADKLGMEIWFPPASIRQRCDNKVETVRIGNRAGVPSVPNVLSRVSSFSHLQRLAEAGGLGKHLVIQAPFGDSGHTTYFISNRTDWRRHAAEITAEDEVKIMKRIRPLGTTLEACVTRCGTVVGPLLTEIIGHPDLTPYAGGWCGNEVFPGAFREDVRATVRRYAEDLGAQLYSEGYRGYFDVDFLIDQDSDEVYLGELNPRVCGASPLTNHAAFAHADVPLFLFHLLEFSGADFDLDVAEINDRWADQRYIDEWSEIVIKSTAPEMDVVTEAPPSGLWRLGEGGKLTYLRPEYDRMGVESEREGIFLRITGAGDCRYQGADLGILITRGRAMDDEFALNDRARSWVRGFSARYRAGSLATEGSCELRGSAFKIT